MYVCVIISPPKQILLPHREVLHTNLVINVTPKGENCIYVNIPTDDIFWCSFYNTNATTLYLLFELHTKLILIVFAYNDFTLILKDNYKLQIHYLMCQCQEMK